MLKVEGHALDKTERAENFSRNLAVLCKSHSSVADICRRIGINRQQFNKYLAGKHLPSGRARQNIAEFFDLDEQDLFKSPARFDGMIESPQLDISLKMRSSSAFQRILPFIDSSSERTKAYFGTYFRYHNSSIYRGKVLRSVLHLYQQNGTAQYVVIERFPSLDGRGHRGCIFKYHGFAIYAGDRLFLVDFETLQRNELTFSIVLPNSRNLLTRLFGLVTGIAASPLREPFSARVAFDFRGERPIRKGDLKCATTLDPDDESIPIEIRNFLREPDATFIWGRQ